MSTAVSASLSRHSSFTGTAELVSQRLQHQSQPAAHHERVLEGLQRAKEIDLKMVRMKLANPDDEVTIHPDHLDEAIDRYREFLALLYAYPGKTIVPSKPIDVVWHQHILDTRAYETDTKSVFGFFLHHYPYFGLMGADDANHLEHSFKETCLLWQMHFGHNPTTDMTSAGGPSACGGKCSSCKS